MARQRRVIQAQFKSETSRSVAGQVKTSRSDSLPASLQSNLETLGGVDLSDVVVQRNSAEPASIGAAAYAQGNQIHLSTGAEQHLPHEAWHVVQQKQNRVSANTSVQGQAMNDNSGLEREADQMGQRAMQMQVQPEAASRQAEMGTAGPEPIQRQNNGVIQRYANVIYVIHPRHDRVLPWNLVIGQPGMYHDATYDYHYNIDNHQFWDDNRNPVANPLGDVFDEDAAQGNAGSQTDTHHTLSYDTDSFNRVTRVRGTITLGGTETGRSGMAQTESWRHMWLVHRSLFYGSTEFNGGHILAHHFGGSPGTHNMVPMEKAYNQSPGNNSYKDFENSLDNIITARGQLNIDIRVGYPANTVAGALSDLWSADNGGQIANINADNKAADTVKRLFRIIPNQIQVHSLTSMGGFPLAPVNEIGNIVAPRNPRLPMKKGIRSNYNVQNIYKTSFDVRSKDEQGHWSTKTFSPYKKKYGDNKGADVDQTKDFEHDYANQYKDMPEPGITSFLPAVNGLAGGVEAYLWMDPMGIFNKFGGTDTVDTVDPLGTNWAYFRKAYEPAHAGNGFNHRNGIYKKGHLLNALLHGPGTDSRNLVPLTGSANADMSTNFEELVKKEPALVNPRKGVFWRVASQGQVTRPGNWQHVDALAANSGLLWQQESSMPASLLCEAWEGTIYKGIPKKGRLLHRYTVQNKLSPADGNGILNRTESGGLANDTAIHPTVPQGNNAANTYNLVAHQTNNVAFDTGYQLQAVPLLFTVPEQAAHERGVKSRAFDDGYGNQPIPINASATYQDYHARGSRRANTLQGEYNVNGLAIRGATEQAAYDRGQRKFGEREAQALRNLPNPSSLAAQEGFAKGIKKIGYDHGFANAQGPQHQDGQYMRGYRKGQYKIGHENAYERLQLANGNSQDYNDGVEDGIIKRGKHDGEDNLVPQVNGNQYYNRGYATGQELAGYEAGRSDDQTQGGRMNNRDFRRGFDDGQYERGRSHGETGRGAEFHFFQDDPYNRGHRRGSRDLGEDDGRALRAPINPAPNGYMLGYNRAAYAEGERDGLRDNFVRANHIPAYRTGYRNGTHQRQQDYQAGYDEGKRGNFNTDPFNRNHDRGFNDGAQDRQNEQRGYNDGNNLNQERQFQPRAYSVGYVRGVADRGYRDGNNSNINNAVWWRNGDYMRGFRNGRRDLGNSDGYNGWNVRFGQDRDYQDGYNAGSQRRRNERQQAPAFNFNRPYNGGAYNY